MEKISIAILLVFAQHLLHGQSSRPALSAQYATIGAYSQNFTDAFSGAINQASLAQIKNACAGVYGERRFLIKELSNYTAAVVLPSKMGGFGLTINYFGGENFNTSQIGVGYGRKLGGKIDIGVQFNYNTIKLAGYGSSNTVNFEAGALLHLTDKVHIGWHVYNPAGGKFGKQSGEKLAAVYSTGIGYEVSDIFFISTAVNKEEDQPVSINAGFQYIFAGQFFARMGVATAVGNYFFGLGVKWKTCRLDAVTNWHAQLGLTPGIMLLFNFHETAQPKED